MGAASHLGITLGEYDARIRTFIPHYEDMLDVVAGVVGAAGVRAPVVVDLGIGSGALSSRVVAVSPRARIIGIDSDEGMVAVAQRRLGRSLTTTTRGDFLKVDLPRADAMVASFALHHVPTRAKKRAFYARCAKAIRRGGLLVIADCCLASLDWQQRRDHAAWLAHLQKKYTRAAARGYLRAWGHEDVYQRLDDELAMLRSAGFVVDLPWRRDGFAVIVARRR